MRVIVLGNCQRRLIAQAIPLFLPGAEVTELSSAMLKGSPAKLAAQLAGQDMILVQGAGEGRRGPLTSAPLAAAQGRKFALPVFGFRGFQPDCTHLQDAEGRLTSPLGPYHSALTVATFLEGFSVARAARLFNALVFRRLGYLDAYAAAVRHMAARWQAEHGLDLLPRLPAWQAQGAFMLTTNHPRALPVADMVGMVLRRAGLDVPPIEAIADRLEELLSEHAIFPVMPEIARPLGIPSDPLFRGPLRRNGQRQSLALPDFLAASFAQYERMLPRLEAAAADNALVAAARNVLREARPRPAPRRAA